MYIRACDGHQKLTPKRTWAAHSVVGCGFSNRPQPTLIGQWTDVINVNCYSRSILSLIYLCDILFYFIFFSSFRPAAQQLSFYRNQQRKKNESLVICFLSFFFRKVKEKNWYLKLSFVLILLLLPNQIVCFLLFGRLLKISKSLWYSGDASLNEFIIQSIDGRSSGKGQN